MGFKQLRTEIIGGLLWVRQWTFVFFKTRGISWLTEELLDYQKWLCCMQLVLVRRMKSVLEACLKYLERSKN
jgi:hypothetical protein